MPIYQISSSLFLFVQYSCDTFECLDCIVDYELFLQQRYLESEGGTAAIATRMKRKKLYESFPTIDTTLLDQIFEANWCVPLCCFVQKILKWEPLTRSNNLKFSEIQVWANSVDPDQTTPGGKTTLLEF